MGNRIQIETVVALLVAVALVFGVVLLDTMGMSLTPLFLIGLALPAAIVVLQRPVVGVYMLTVFILLGELLPEFGQITPNRVMGALTLFALMIQKNTGKRERKFKFDVLDWLFLAYILAGFVSIGFNGNLRDGDSVLLKIIVSYLHFFLFRNLITDWGKFRKVLWACLFSFSVQALGVARDIILGLEEARFAGFVSGGESLEGAYAAVGILLGFWLMSGSNKKTKLLLLALQPLLVVYLLATGSRIGILTLFSGSAILLLLRRGTFVKRATVPLIIALLFVVGVVFANVVAPKALERGLLNIVPALQTAGDFEDIADAEKRVIFINATIAMFSDRPILGIGLRNFSERVEDYLPVVTSSVLHGVFFSTLAEMGFIGITIVVSLFGITTMSLLRIRRTTVSDQGYQASIFALAIFVGYNVFDSLLHASYIDRQMFIVFAIAATVPLIVAATEPQPTVLQRKVIRKTSLSTDPAN
jgi:O-antigen ligase